MPKMFNKNYGKYSLNIEKMLNKICPKCSIKYAENNSSKNVQ